ncbi:hypothetical protein [Mycoplasma hafezii]|uniref:SLAC1 family transporter n=1 Tax=Mycoplasma hafezii TaxID=525886 RepID=UPI003CF3F772
MNLNKEKWNDVPLGINSVALGTMGIATAGTFLSTELYHRITDNPMVLTRLNYFLCALEIFCIVVCCFYLFFVLTKYFILKFKHLPSEFQRPSMVGSVGVTMLCFCVISNSLGWVMTNMISDQQTRYYALIFPNILAFCAVSMQLFYMFFFFKKYIFKKGVIYQKAYASWFVPLVGVGISAAYADNLGDLLPIWYWQAIWFLAFGVFVITYPVFLYRFLFKPHTDEKHIPSMAIYASPANMLGLGFLVAFNPDRNLAGFTVNALNNVYFYEVVSIILFSWGVVSVVIYGAVYIKSLKLKEHWLAYGALTFPAAVSASGTAFYARYFFLQDFVAAYWTLFVVAVLLFLMSFYIVALLNVKYSKLLFEIFKKRGMN